MDREESDPNGLCPHVSCNFLLRIVIVVVLNCIIIFIIRRQQQNSRLINNIQQEDMIFLSISYLVVDLFYSVSLSYLNYLFRICVLLLLLK